MLIIGILVIVNAADARPAGTIIKEGVLTYPAGPYLIEDPLLLSLEGYGDDIKAQTSGDSFKKIYLEKECLFFDYNGENIIPGNPGAGNFWICPYSHLSMVTSEYNATLLHLK
jgi:hypothetical protein